VATVADKQYVCHRYMHEHTAPPGALTTLHVLVLRRPLLQLVNWIGGDLLDGEAAVLAFTCKGTDAAAYKECATATDAGMPGTLWRPGASAFLSLSFCALSTQACGSRSIRTFEIF
jgi:hypothetical protein